MAVSSAPGTTPPGTMTLSAWAVMLSLIAGSILVIAIAANAQDAPMAIHAWIFVFAFLAGIMAIGQRHMNATSGRPLADDGTGYADGVVKAGAIATLFWGVVGFTVGVVIAFQLTYPALNFDTDFLNFGRLRPLHTSAVVFAFGGNALIATSFYVVQRTSRARLAGDLAPWFVFWGYQLFIVIAATGYLMGVTQSKEYAEPEWYADIWLTIVWMTYLVVFLGTLAKRKEPHIYVANWFYLAFIVTIAMLHIGNNLAIPETWSSSKSYALFPGVQDALIQWWYGHNAVGFFLTAGFLGMMYYFVPKRAERPVYSYRLSIVHFWSLIFIYIWAGPHHLHFTALPDWAQTLGMTFSIMLWMPSWGGMINGLMTLSGAWDKLRTDPVIRMLVVSIRPEVNDRLLAAFGLTPPRSRPARRGEAVRDTKETRIVCAVDLDTPGPVGTRTGVGFFDHMIEQVAAHGGFSIRLSCDGDLHIDPHHTVEDCAIALGQALKQALGERRGIGRYGFVLPMDEAEAKVSIDLSGRPYAVFEGTFATPFIGEYRTDLTAHVFRSLAEHLGAAIHVSVTGEDDHHKTEACFKALGRALKQAIRVDGDAVPSTKGVL